jgi:hypothetical protein
MNEKRKLSMRMWGSAIEVSGAEPVMIVARAVSILLVVRALVGLALLGFAARAWLLY